MNTSTLPNNHLLDGFNTTRAKKFQFSSCSCDASLSQEHEKKVPASPCCHLQTLCHILSQQGSIFATVPRRQLHMSPPLVQGTPKMTLWSSSWRRWGRGHGQMGLVSSPSIPSDGPKGSQSFAREDLGCRGSSAGAGWVFGCLTPLQHFCRLINPQKAPN